MFANKKEAELWSSEQERAIRLTGLPASIENLKKPLSYFAERYLEEITPTKLGARDEALRLKKFLRHRICSTWVAYLTRPQVYAYRDERLKEVSLSTVRRELNVIQHIFEVAKDQWGFDNLTNHFRDVNLRNVRGKGKVLVKRRRRLESGELEKIIKHSAGCRGLNKLYLPLAIYLTIETGMRLQEVFNLTWEDVDINERTIEVRKSKTDYQRDHPGRTIVMPWIAKYFLTRGAFNRRPEDKDTDRIFPMTKEAFKQSFADLRKRAGIKRDRNGEILEYRDLRREAGSIFDEAELTRAEHNLMLGHGTNDDISQTYIASRLKTIRDKLDRYVHEGETEEEMIKKYGSVVIKGRYLEAVRNYMRITGFKNPKDALNISDWQKPTGRQRRIVAVAERSEDRALV
jgi:integrase